MSTSTRSRRVLSLMTTSIRIGRRQVLLQDHPHGKKKSKQPRSGVDGVVGVDSFQCRCGHCSASTRPVGLGRPPAASPLRGAAAPFQAVGAFFIVVVTTARGPASTSRRSNVVPSRCTSVVGCLYFIIHGFTSGRFHCCGAPFPPLPWASD